MLLLFGGHSFSFADENWNYLKKKQVAKLKFTYFDLKQIEPSKQFRKLENTVLDHLTSIITYCTLRSCRNNYLYRKLYNYVYIPSISLAFSSSMKKL